MDYYSGAEELEGQGLVEYALILLLVALVVIAALGILGGELVDVFSNVADRIADPEGE